MRYLFLLLLLLATARLQAQEEIKSYVVAETKAVRSVNPDSTDFSDLENFGRAVGDARIVMLGEQDHGDAPAFQAKTRLIKYLHEKKGFSVIAFESDFFSATCGFENNTNNAAAYLSFYRANLVPYWTLCDACSHLFTKLIPESFSSTRPFVIAGFDNQMIYRHATASLANYIDSLAAVCGLEIRKQEAVYSKILTDIRTLSDPVLCSSAGSAFLENAGADLLLLKNEFQQKKGAEHIACLLLQNQIVFAQQLKIKNDFTRSANMRDQQMAAILTWLCRVKYPEQKIIVWAANYHVSKYMGHFGKKAYNENRPMASLFAQDSALSAQTYSLGFTSGDGEAGRLGTQSFPVNRPAKNGFETWIDPAMDYAFVDFRKFNGQYPQYSTLFEMKSCVSANNVHQSFPGQWNKIFDGIFFIRHMYPCRLKKAE